MSLYEIVSLCVLAFVSGFVAHSFVELYGSREKPKPKPKPKSKNIIVKVKYEGIDPKDLADEAVQYLAERIAQGIKIENKS